MPPAPTLPELVLAGSVSKRADVLVIGLTSGSDGPEVLLGDGLVDEAVLGDLLDAATAVGATGKSEELTRVPPPQH